MGNKTKILHLHGLCVSASLRENLRSTCLCGFAPLRLPRRSGAKTGENPFHLAPFRLYNLRVLD